MIIVFLGPPGSGKGTQAKLFKDREGFLHVSTGDILREAVNAGTKLGIEASGYMKEGRLVPDQVVVNLVAEMLSSNSGKRLILDGFPRNVAQALSLDKILSGSSLKIDCVYNFLIDNEVVVNRLAGRRTCGKCSAVFNTVGAPPKREGVCDKCGGDLIQRADDDVQVVRNRLDLYVAQTEPIVDHYGKSGNVVVLNADAPVENLYQDISDSLKKLGS